MLCSMHAHGHTVQYIVHTHQHNILAHNSLARALLNCSTSKTTANLHTNCTTWQPATPSSSKLLSLSNRLFHVHSFMFIHSLSLLMPGVSSLSFSWPWCCCDLRCISSPFASTASAASCTVPPVVAGC